MKYLQSNMKDEILEFINRRFPKDCDWLNGNCFYFAKILQARFSGAIFYDLIDGHFLFYRICNDKSKEGFYDYSGKVNPITERLVSFEEYRDVDHLHWEHIVRDCVW